MSKFLLGLVMIIASYLILFVPKTFEFMEDHIPVGSIEGVGLLFFGIGIMGMFLIYGSLR